MEERLISLYLSRILSGYYFIFYNNKKYKVKYPNIHVKYEADILADEAYDQVKYNGWYNKENIVHQLISMGVWSYEGDLNLKRLDKQIEDYKVQLYENYFNPNKVKQIRRNLVNTRKNYDKLYTKRHAYDHITIEGYCDNVRNDFLLMNSIYDDEGDLFFDKNKDYTVYNQMISAIMNNSISITDFKKIARSDLWRNYWSANNKGIFSAPVMEWTDEQKTLVVLTKMYDGARESMEAPPDHVYEDDDMFDGWMILQKREQEKSREKKKIEKALPGKMGKAQEVFLVANSNEEAQDIYKINDTQSRGIIKERQQFINRSSKDNINASELPDVKRDIIIQSSEQRKGKGK